MTRPARRSAPPLFLRNWASTADDSPAGRHGYGLIVTIFSREVFRRSDIRVVLPNLGKSGLVTGVGAVNPFRRPGDLVDFYATGTGFRPEDANLLTAEGVGIHLGEPRIIYDSPTRIELEFKVPADAAVGTYGLDVQGSKFETLVREKNAFSVVPPLWIDGALVSPPAAPGRKSRLKLTGRDFTADFAKTVRVEMDEPGIHVSEFSFQDPSTLAAQIEVDASVAPGDYLLHLTAQGNPIKPQFGGVIQVAARP